MKKNRYEDEVFALASIGATCLVVGGFILSYYVANAIVDTNSKVLKIEGIRSDLNDLYRYHNIDLGALTQRVEALEKKCK